MMNKLHEILKQYEKEVDMINDMFIKNKQTPPLSKGQPPIGGAILWERSLFDRIKKTIVRFLTYEEMMNCEEGQAVKARVLKNIVFNSYFLENSKNFLIFRKTSNKFEFSKK